MKSFLSSALLLTSVAALPRPSNQITRLPTIRAHPQRRANQIIPVIVGGPQDTFVPNSVVAAVGDVVQFQFSNGNHTVTQSTADVACSPLEGGIHSGHIPFEDGQTEVGTFNMPVTSTEPMFLYCATGPHCQAGQVMVVNAVNAQQVAEYAKLSQATESSTDGTDVVGGTPGNISLEAAAFTPAPPEEEAAAPPAPPAEAPPAEAPPAEAPPAEAPPAEAPPAEAPPAEAPPAEAPPAEAPPAEEAPAEAPPAEAPPAEEAPAEEPPAEAPPAEAPPAEAPPAEEEAPAEGEAPVEGEAPPVEAEAAQMP